MFKTKRQKKLSFILFGIYIFLLAWLILFKFSFDFNRLPYIRNINLIPYHEPTIINGKVAINEMIYNLLVFVPLGVYISIFKSEWSFLKKAVPGFCLSLLFETLQFAFAIGASDITDVIGNTLGGIIGVVLCILFHKVFKNKTVPIMIKTHTLVVNILIMLHYQGIF